MFSREQKEQLRQEMLQKRSQLTLEYQQTASKRIVEKLLSSDEYSAAEVIFAYIPFREEVNISSFIEECWRDHKKLYVPKSDKKNYTMKFYKIEHWNDLEKGNYGILEPKATCENHRDEPIDFILIPGVAFDRRMGRVGYGAGYYDRYLNGVRNQPYLLAPAYSIQILPKVPIDPWDIRIHAIVTEEEWIVH